MSAYILRTCKADMTSRDGFVWPESGHVAAPDWNPKPECGGGLHGLLHGEGGGSQLHWSSDAKWIVARVETWVDLNGKVKFPEAWVEHVGDQKSATDFITEKGCRGPVVGCFRAGGDEATVSGGYRATVTGGDEATVSGGYRAILSVKWQGGGRFRIAVAYVGEDGIKPDTPYRVEGGKFVEATK